MEAALIHEKALKEAESSYATLQLEAHQKQLIENIAAGFAQRLNIGTPALKGFLWYAARDWQVQEQRPISDIPRMSPVERRKAIEKFFQCFRQQIVTVLISPTSIRLVDQTISDFLAKQQKATEEQRYEKEYNHKHRR